MATRADLYIDQGATFVADLSLTDEDGQPLSLINYSAASQVRKQYSSLTAAATFTTSINTESSTVTLSLTANQTSAMEAGRYVYDVELNQEGVVSRILEGVVTVAPQVTR